MNPTAYIFILITIPDSQFPVSNFRFSNSQSYSPSKHIQLIPLLNEKKKQGNSQIKMEKRKRENERYRITQELVTNESRSITNGPTQ